MYESYKNSQNVKLYKMMTNDAIALKIPIMRNFSWQLKWLQGPLRKVAVNKMMMQNIKFKLSKWNLKMGWKCAYEQLKWWLRPLRQESGQKLV